MVNNDAPHAFREFVRKIQVPIPQNNINKKENLKLVFVLKICEIYKRKIIVNQAPAIFALLNNPVNPDISFIGL